MSLITGKQIGLDEIHLNNDTSMEFWKVLKCQFMKMSFYIERNKGSEVLKYSELLPPL